MKNEKSDPKVKFKNDDRITLEGSTKEKMNNISILLRNLEFTDTGKYTCHVQNPKENNFQHQATIFLQVVDKRKQWGPGRGQWSGKHGRVPHSVGSNGMSVKYAFKSYWSHIWRLR